MVVEDGAHILANCHFVGAHIGKGARVGPFARFRPGADIGERAHVGNFVEIKNTRIENGAKANHLAYIGDGRVGEGANIGAGTIFCNYDGFNKHFTDVGKGAFIGSNSSARGAGHDRRRRLHRLGQRHHPGTWSPTPWRWSAAPQETRPGWAARFQMSADGKAPQLSPSRRLRINPEKRGHRV